MVRVLALAVANMVAWAETCVTELSLFSFVLLPCLAQPGKMVDHVLGEFSKPEKKVLEEVIMDATEAIEGWMLEENIDKVMNW